MLAPQSIRYASYTRLCTLITVLLVSLGIHLAALQADAAILWSSAGGNAWLTGSNWNGGNVPSSGDVAQFGTNPTSATTGVGINMNNPTNNGTNNQAVGAIEITSARSNNFLIGNSSSLVNGILTLNGANVSSIDDVILRSASNGNFTLQNTQGGANKTTDIALGDATNNIVLIDGGGNIVISAKITGASSKLTLSTSAANPAGRLDLTGTANTFGGGVFVKAAELRISADGSLGAAANSITIDGGRLSTTSSLTVGSGRDILLGSTAGTSISTINASNVLTYSGVIKDLSTNGILVKQGTGTLALGGVSTYTGSTSVGTGNLTCGKK